MVSGLNATFTSDASDLRLLNKVRDPNNPFSIAFYLDPSDNAKPGATGVLGS
jgi:hypothetical protein